MITKGLRNTCELLEGKFALRTFLVSAAMVIIALSAGCGLIPDKSSNAGQSGESGAAAGEESATKSETASGPCDNEYYPIEPGTRKRFKSSSSAAGKDTEITLEQTAPEGDSFSETRTLDSGLTVTTPWKCEDGGLRIAEYQNFIESNKMNFTMETVDSSGLTIPSSWKEGDQWESNYKVKVNLKAGPVNTNAGGTVNIKDKLLAKSDNVKVQGGEFDAAKVESVIKISVSLGGREIPSQDIKLTRWYSPKVGLVKQESSGPFGTETIEYAGVAQ